MDDIIKIKTLTKIIAGNKQEAHQIEIHTKDNEDLVVFLDEQNQVLDLIIADLKKFYILREILKKVIN